MYTSFLVDVRRSPSGSILADRCLYMMSKQSCLQLSHLSACTRWDTNPGQKHFGGGGKSTGKIRPKKCGGWSSRVPWIHQGATKGAPKGDKSILGTSPGIPSRISVPGSFRPVDFLARIACLPDLSPRFFLADLTPILSPLPPIDHHGVCIFC